MRDKSNPKLKYTRGRPTSRRRSEVSKALAELRHRMGHSQQSMAGLLGVALQSVARWETVVEPQGYTLHMLLAMSRIREYDDLSAVFEAALAKFKLEEPRVAEDIEADIKCWDEISAIQYQLALEGQSLRKKGHPAGDRIHQKLVRLGDLTQQAKRLAWRNR